MLVKFFVTWKVKTRDTLISVLPEIAFLAIYQNAKEKV